MENKAKKLRKNITICIPDGQLGKQCSDYIQLM